MNTALVQNWNNLVAPEDTVWHLGDLSLGVKIEEEIALTRELNGHKRLVPGNHDRVALTYKSGAQKEHFLPLYQEAGWDIMPEIIHHQIAGIEVLVCHFPYVGDSGSRADRYVAARPVDTGLPIIHGHVHTAFSESGSQFNVGVDVRGYAPVSERSLSGFNDSEPIFLSVVKRCITSNLGNTAA